MYILPHLCVIKNFWSSKILDQFWKVLWIFKVLELHIFQGINVFLMWSIVLFLLISFPSNVFYYIWVLLIVLFKIDSCLTHCCSLFKVLNQNFILKFHQMDFQFKFLDIHRNEKVTICHDCHGFKWQNINIYLILIILICGLMPFWLVGFWLHPIK
jgi:hypothetical protein